jgi:hypothetical protein
LAAQQIGDQLWEPIEFISHEPVFDRDVPPFDKAGFAQAFEECRHHSSAPLRRTHVKISHHTTDHTVALPSPAINARLLIE